MLDERNRKGRAASTPATPKNPRYQEVYLNVSRI
jgi:hypothetical protein